MSMVHDLATETLLANIKQRSHNYPEDMQKDEIQSGLEELFDKSVEKSASYLLGSQITEKNSTENAYFNVLSLGNWLMIAQASDVSFVPATPIGTLPSLVPLKIAGGHAPQKEEIQAFSSLANAVKEISSNHIVRADMAAAANLKIAVQNGSVPMMGPDQDIMATLSDPRIVEQSMSWPEEHFMVWARPWLTAQMKEGISTDTGEKTWFPMEWRVYVENSKIIGVSSYYPQSPVTSDDWYAVSEEVISASNRMISLLKDKKAWPHHPMMENRNGAVNLDSVNATFDFLVDQDGQPLLIEGGPAHLRNPGWGAHPCSFAELKENGQIKNLHEISGLALGNGQIEAL